jgi:hypothetical protein
MTKSIAGSAALRDMPGKSTCSPKATGAGQGEKPQAKGALGNTEKGEQHQLWWLQSILWRVTKMSRLRGCHRWMAPYSGAATVRWAPGEARMGGLQRSHSVWSSPLDAAQASKLRTVEIKHGLERWLEQDERNGIYFGTFTLRHHKGQSLGMLWDASRECWNRILKTASWRGGPRMVGDRQRFGVVHFVKAVEVTYGENGWHVHLHVIFFTSKRLSADERESLRGRLYSRWAKQALRMGLEAPSYKRAVRIDDACDGGETGALGAYLAKGQIGGLARELANGTGKRGRGKKSRTPFQILADLGEEETPEDLALWHEWEKESSGRRQIAWSRGAKDDLGISDMTDEELLAEDEVDFNKTAVDLVRICHQEWMDKSNRGLLVCDDMELRETVLAAAREATDRHEAIRAVSEILTAVGVEHGICDVDIIPPGEEDSPTREELRAKAASEAREIFAERVRAAWERRQATKSPKSKQLEMDFSS